MHVLDLGCGKARSSIFLAKEFGLRVTAVDLWNSPTSNCQLVQEAGLEKQVYPVFADARDLPFPHETFDAVIAVDSFQYFGTCMMYLPYVLQYLKPNGLLAFVSAGLMKHFSGDVVPEHLRQFWTPDAWSLKTSDWWRRHWERTGLVDVQVADTMQDGWQFWLRWAEANGGSNWYVETLQQDAGEYLGYVRQIAVRRPDAPTLSYDLRTGAPVARRS